MIWNDIELFNVAEIEQREDGAWRLYRFPRKVREVFAKPGFEGDPSDRIGQMTTGCELRFVCDAVDIELSASANGIVEIFRGDYSYRIVPIKDGERVSISLRKDTAIESNDISGVHHARFSPDVWRVTLGNDNYIVLHEIKAHAPIRPPRSDELPHKTILAYGSSITQGFNADLHSTSYVMTMGRVLGTDVLCKGMGGSCFCQREVADYIANEGWDVALLELGINMVSRFEVEEFERRATALVKDMLACGKPVVLISNYTCLFDLPDHVLRDKNDQYVKTTERIVEMLRCDNLYYIRGRDIVDTLALLAADLIHPSTYGHTEMGRRIARKLRDEFHIL